ncbi:MAG: hypothetical protein U5L45_20320 [Saprospiraceae bacterium]|nr:hypothetical protein [Saprospiraceae bacterium]
MVHFSGKARKINHLSSFCASEASAKVPFNAYFEFMYGFKSKKRVYNKFSLLIFIARFACKKRVFRFWASPKIETHLPCFTSEASYKTAL